MYRSDYWHISCTRCAQGTWSYPLSILKSRPPDQYLHLSCCPTPHISLVLSWSPGPLTSTYTCHVARHPTFPLFFPGAQAPWPVPTPHISLVLPWSSDPLTSTYTCHVARHPTFPLFFAGAEAPWPVPTPVMLPDTPQFPCSFLELRPPDQFLYLSCCPTSHISLLLSWSSGPLTSTYTCHAVWHTTFPLISFMHNYLWKYNSYYHNNIVYK